MLGVRWGQENKEIPLQTLQACLQLEAQITTQSSPVLNIINLKTKPPHLLVVAFRVTKLKVRVDRSDEGNCSVTQLRLSGRKRRENSLSRSNRVLTYKNSRSLCLLSLCACSDQNRW